MGQLLRALSDRLALPCAQGLGPFLVPPQLPLQGPAKAQHGHGPQACSVCLSHLHWDFTHAAVRCKGVSGPWGTI